MADKYSRFRVADTGTWDGKGFPPLGCECEWQDKNTKHWIKVRVVYSSEWVTVIREDKIADPVELAIENYGDEARRQFRPIRTEAEKRRCDDISEMMHVGTSLPAGIPFTREEMTALYDAGYRKVKLEDA